AGRAGAHPAARVVDLDPGLGGDVEQAAVLAELAERERGGVHRHFRLLAGLLVDERDLERLDGLFRLDLFDVWVYAGHGGVLRGAVRELDGWNPPTRRSAAPHGDLPLERGGRCAAAGGGG